MSTIFTEPAKFLGYIDPGTGFTITTAGGLMVMFLTGALGFLLLFLKRLFKFFRKHKKPIIIILVIVAGALMSIFHFMKEKSGGDFRHKIVVIGFDALSPQIVDSLLAQGRLPNFRRLRQQGSYRQLQTTNPPQSPVAWAAFSTGKNPGKNGMYEFIMRDPETYKLRLSLADTETGSAVPVVRTPRFWQILARKKVPAVILACPVTFPPDRINGRMLSGMGVPDVLGTEGTFTFYTTAGEEERETTGGKVFHVRKSPTMVMHLLGPKVAGAGGIADHVRVPFKLEFKGGRGIAIACQNKTIELKEGEWSDWQDVTFDLGVFRQMKGIFKFYLVEAEPELKLYITPINLDPRAPYFPISFPKGYSRDLAGRIGLYHTQGMPFDTWALNEKRIDEKIFLDNVQEVLQEKEKMLDLELQRFQKGVLFAYFESPDIIQHMFWRYIDPRHPLYDPNAPREYKEMVNNWYVKMDRILGRVMATLQEGDTLIVLSDHGFNTFRRAVHLNSWLRDNGYLELEDAGAISGQPLLKSVDWSRTRAYAIGFGAIYINEQGREGKGIVPPGREKEQLKQEIARKLEQWFDDKYQERIVRRVYKQEEVFWGKYQDETPDLLVGYNTGYRASWQTALGDVPGDLLEDNLRKWSGSHLFDASLVPGVLFASETITKHDPSIMDVAPTILKLVGFTDEEIKACDFDGRPLW